MVKKKYFLIAAIFIGVFNCFFIQPEFVSAGPFSFFVESEYDLSKRSQITATLRGTSQNAYFFVDDEWWEKLTAGEQLHVQNSIDSLLVEFDNVIYPELTKFLGNIWSPGIDNDSKITILALPLIEVAGGYINYSDEYPKNRIERSNEREMVYLNTTTLNSLLAKGFLAHEFQHLITFYQKEVLHDVSEDVWLNEARSEHVSSYLGYDNTFGGSNLERRVKAFLKDPSDALCEFKNEPADYANLNLFLQYLTDHYGKEIISEMIKDEKVGIESINNALKKKGFNTSFSEVFTNWTIANFLNNCSFGELYCYLNPNLKYDNLHIVLGKALSVPGIAQNPAIKDWQPIYYQFEPIGEPSEKNLKIYFEKGNPQDIFKAPYIIRNSDGTTPVNYMEITNNKATVYISGFGQKVASVTFMPSKQSKFSDFTDNDPVSSFKLTGELIDKIPVSQYPDGSLLRVVGDFKVYLIEHGQRHWIPTAQIFNFYNLEWGNIREVNAADLENFPRAKLLRAKGDYKVYYLTENGLIRHIPSAEVFLSYGNKWEDIIEIDSEELKAYAPNSLIQLTGDYKIYKLENGKKRWIKTVAAFNRLKLDWSKIAPVNLTEFNAHLEGAPIN